MSGDVYLLKATVSPGIMQYVSVRQLGQPSTASQTGMAEGLYARVMQTSNCRR